MTTRLLGILAALVAAGTGSQGLSRLPLQKARLKLESPQTWQLSERRDAKTGRIVEYDPKPRIVTLDAKARLFGFKWIGSDGREKAISYHLPDAVDVVVRAAVSRVTSGTYEYVYRVDNLASSGGELRGFVVQTFSKDLTQRREPGVFTGEMHTAPFVEGRWMWFSLLDLRPVVRPGRTVSLRLTSSDGPGLVECRAHGGDLAIKGVGEELPQELAAMLPGKESWPRGYTIGPDARIRRLTRDAKAQQLLEWLPRFESLGWLASGRRQHYEAVMRAKGLGAAVVEAEADLTNGKATPEVVAIVRHIAVD